MTSDLTTMSSSFQLSAQAKPFHVASLSTSRLRNLWDCQYRYSPLETPTTIRILRLQPGSATEPLQGEIFYGRLEVST